MTVKLTIELEGPVSPDDKDILTGATMILMALTQKAVGEEQEEEPAREDREEMEVEDSAIGAPSDLDVAAFVAVLSADPPIPEPCGAEGPDGRICFGTVGHRGRHLFRKPAVPGMN